MTGIPFQSMVWERRSACSMALVLRNGRQQLINGFVSLIRMRADTDHMEDNRQMGTRVHSNASTNYAEKEQEMKAIYCPKCGRKVTEVQMMEGYLTCPKCRYNYYKFVLGGFDLNISSHLLENYPVVIAILKLIRKIMHKIYLDNDVGDMEMAEELIRAEESLPFY